MVSPGSIIACRLRQLPALRRGGGSSASGPYDIVRLHGVLRYRKFDTKAGGERGGLISGNNGDGAAILLDQFPGNPQTNAGSDIVFGGEKWIEDSFKILQGNSNAGVANGDRRRFVSQKTGSHRPDPHLLPGHHRHWKVDSSEFAATHQAAHPLSR